MALKTADMGYVMETGRVTMSGPGQELLANDSVLITGDGLLQTFDRLEVAEFSAKSLIMAAPIGELKPITDKEVEDLRVAFHVK